MEAEELTEVMRYRRMMNELADLTGDGWTIHLSLAPDAKHFMQMPCLLVFRQRKNGVNVGAGYSMRVNRFALPLELPAKIHRFHSLYYHPHQTGGLPE